MSFSPWTPLGAAVDRVALSLMERMWLSDEDPTRDELRPRQEAIFERYSVAPDRAWFPEPPPARFEPIVARRTFGGSRSRVRWESGYRTWDSAAQAEFDAYEANRHAWAELWRHGGARRPTVVALHSWATGFFRLNRVVYDVRRLFWLDGFDVALLMLPFHGPRTPSQALFGGQLFPGARPDRTNEAFRQAVWDARRLLATLRAEGAGPIGVMGMSLGGYLTALLAGLEPELAFAVPMLPLVSFPDLLWSHGAGTPQRARAEARGVTIERLRSLYAMHGPLGYPPLVPWERRLILAGRGDRVVTKEHVALLQAHWGEPKTVWFPGGHIAQGGRVRALDEVRSFLRGLS